MTGDSLVLPDVLSNAAFPSIDRWVYLNNEELYATLEVCPAVHLRLLVPQAVLISDQEALSLVDS